MKGNQAEKAESLFKEGYAWSQAILAGFGEACGLDPQTAIRLARSFGSGMGLGRTCGALTASFMILGLQVRDAGDEREARYRTYDLAREFVRRFEELHGSSVCKELLEGVDLATKAGLKEAQERNLFTERCPVFVRDAANILEDML